MQWQIFFLKKYLENKKNKGFWRIFDEVCETSKGYAKRSQKEEEKEDYNRQHSIKTPKFPRLKQGTKFYSVHCVTS